MCPRSWHARVALAASHINPSTEDSQISKEFDFFPREENQIVWETLVTQQRTNAQLNSHMAPAGSRTRGHLGERRAPYAQANHATHSQPFIHSLNHLSSLGSIQPVQQICPTWLNQSQDTSLPYQVPIYPG